ncbi:MarR family winged helix-turn-helix transcriptional regulator [Vibrio sp. EA2]|uniref:MarR family winged helix-turn-helix transcriptional regulator n=1 Tax=Vibrio sp. EA2 TaxID=3079860 RepID=UPI00294902CC|nr:MarR family transcriptional regulator [Vibrio sp. EA2]MDV6252608.1 MarR family transcriptional regulator [Vibrio sp. EA2]
MKTTDTARTGDDCAMRLYHQFRNITNYINDLKRTELKHHRITPNEFTILDVLQQHSTKGYLTPSELAYYTRVTTGTITGRLDSLERKELTLRYSDPVDRRSIRVQLTEKGQERTLQYRKDLNQICKRTFHSLNQAELKSTLSKISLGSSDKTSSSPRLTRN